MPWNLFPLLATSHVIMLGRVGDGTPGLTLEFQFLRALRVFNVKVRGCISITRVVWVKGLNVLRAYCTILAFRRANKNLSDPGTGRFVYHCFMVSFGQFSSDTFKIILFAFPWFLLFTILLSYHSKFYLIINFLKFYFSFLKSCLTLHIFFKASFYFVALVGLELTEQRLKGSLTISTPNVLLSAKQHGILIGILLL